MTKDKALYEFMNTFGYSFYPTTAVPENASMPYGTYTPVFDMWGGSPVALTVNLWDRTESEALMNERAQKISDVIGNGKYVPCDGGAILLTCGSPFSQSLIDETDDTVKRRYINITAEYITLH